MQTVTNNATGAVIYSGPDGYFNFTPYLVCADFIDTNCTPNLFTINYGVVQVPQSITPFQAKAALLNAGLLSQVNAIMANSATPPLMVLAWTDATEFLRTSTTVTAMAASLNLTSAQIDALFIEAAGISA